VQCVEERFSPDACTTLCAVALTARKGNNQREYSYPFNHKVPDFQSPMDSTELVTFFSAVLPQER
jgi:hypothetical protein